MSSYYPVSTAYIIYPGMWIRPEKLRASPDVWGVVFAEKPEANDWKVPRHQAEKYRSQVMKNREKAYKRSKSPLLSKHKRKLYSMAYANLRNEDFTQDVYLRPLKVHGKAIDDVPPPKN